jgi:hypothetical protein
MFSGRINPLSGCLFGKTDLESVMSQAFAEIRHLRKCLGFPQLPRQLQKWNLIYYIQNLGNGKTQKN